MNYTTKFIKKKIISLFLIVILLFTLTIPALARPPGSGTAEGQAQGGGGGSGSGGPTQSAGWRRASSWNAYLMANSANAGRAPQTGISSAICEGSSWVWWIATGDGRQVLNPAGDTRNFSGGFPGSADWHEYQTNLPGNNWHTGNIVIVCSGMWGGTSGPPPPTNVCEPIPLTPWSPTNPGSTRTMIQTERRNQDWVDTVHGIMYVRKSRTPEGNLDTWRNSTNAYNTPGWEWTGLRETQLQEWWSRQTNWNGTTGQGAQPHTPYGQWYYDNLNTILQIRSGIQSMTVWQNLVNQLPNAQPWFRGDLQADAITRNFISVMSEDAIRNSVDLYAEHGRTLTSLLLEGALYFNMIQTMPHELVFESQQCQERTRTITQTRSANPCPGHTEWGGCSMWCSSPCTDDHSYTWYCSGWSGGQPAHGWGPWGPNQYGAWSLWSDVGNPIYRTGNDILSTFQDHSWYQNVFALCVTPEQANSIGAVGVRHFDYSQPAFVQATSHWNTRPWSVGGNVTYALLTDMAGCNTMVVCTPERQTGANNDSQHNRNDFIPGPEVGSQSGSPLMSSRLFQYFRDNREQDIRLNLWYPNHTNPANPHAVINPTLPARQTRLTFDPLGTPDTDVFILRESNRNILINGLQIRQNNPNIISQIHDRQINRFIASSSWASHGANPQHRWNTHWLFDMGLAFNVIGYHAGGALHIHDYIMPVNVQCDMLLNTNTPVHGRVTMARQHHPASGITAHINYHSGETFRQQPRPNFDDTGIIPVRGQPHPTDISHWIGTRFVRAIRE